jgi:ribosomal protein S12 methylthiotransferase accessory factor
MKAVGEALERYGAGCYRTESFRHASESGIPGAVNPLDFVLPGHPDSYDRSESIPWIEGTDLNQKTSVFVPAEFVVFPPPNQRFRPAITTGLGLGSSTVDALLAGLYEVIARDAVMLGWYSSFEPLELTFDDERVRTVRKRASAEELAVTTLLLTQDIDVPVVTACVHREEGWPKFAVGSNAHLDATTAGVGAIEEAVQNWMELDAMGKSRANEEHPNIAEYASFPDSAREFIGVRRTISADALNPAVPPTGREELAEVIDRVSAQDLRVYASRLTTRDLEQVGVEVTRTLIPGAQPLFLGDRYFGDRAESVPADLGFEASLDGPRHPYP